MAPPRSLMERRLVWLLVLMVGSPWEYGLGGTAQHALLVLDTSVNEQGADQSRRCGIAVSVDN